MSSKNKKDNQYSKKILKILGRKPAVALNSLKEPNNPKTSYATARSIKNLVESGCAEMLKSANQNFVRITQKGKTKLDALKLEGGEALVPQTWDGFWRIVLLDLPEDRKNERESLRYLLKKAGFVCLKNSAWISPFPYEHLFTNIKKDLGLTTEIMIIVTEFIDEESKKVLFETFGK
ncbi:MAG: Transcriptional regulator, PaaX family [Candidatus Nomurabacteria bacterium GW2011_GWF2_43_8]|uniref:Transcriptional regulator, PaaX family n=3 Tax=Candidatus Nomuraibacteriota TaxID=1752729 RepID=A0A0G1HV03_9BACT|nr:MAG: Transcriptional regulator, PaaX family [Candidatus Nomurabacteria bacterium GW2011_GWA2_43_15]KKT19043.1 MAG: Transcriptional regulator, PaaX family [Candidatus Nomurabacteria bacterium GW2011_GWB1_43_7]KKT23427.1 MAG: Transcriptional regulator, PaaX family [Candidatus Nomurabacteria bacterium GW2011_GWF2_43_8]